MACETAYQKRMNLRNHRTRIDEKDLVKICYLYYKEGKTQEEISSIFGLNRFKIVRLLKEAKERGIVTIHINDRIEKIAKAEVDLARKFNLKESVVIKIKESTGKSVLDQIGEAGAQYVCRRLKDYTVLGVAWGWTLYHVVKNVGPATMKDLMVVQLSGGLGTIEGTDTSILTMMLSQRLGGRAHVIHAPIIVKNKKSRDAFLKENNISDALAVAKRVDIAVLGIGLVSKEGGLWRARLLNHKDYLKLKKAGAVGAVCGRFYNLNGEECPSGLDDRIIGLTVDELRGIKHKIGIAEGSGKLDAILGAIRAKLLDVLITDEKTAESLLSKSLP
jgi:DNA-binding transcriptional regulator LsrR (DeoR family)